jgi:SpoIID/LytB domain protein
VSVDPGGSVEISSDGGSFRVRPLSGAALGPGAEGEAPALEAAPVPEAPATTSSTIPNLLGIPLGPPPAPAPPPGGPPPPDAAPAPPPPEEAVSGGGLLAEPPEGSTIAVGATGRRYRGTLEAVGGAGGLRLVNEVDVEQYLRGMGEVRDPGWPSASLQAQAIAARTYALRAMRGGGEICDTDQCQVYLGVDVEYSAMDGAVAASDGQVLTYGGSLALSVYSANGGGFSATPDEAWGSGTGDYPYLPATPYPGVPDVWSLRMSLPDLAGRLGYPGELTGAGVSRAGPSGRPLEVMLEGTGGAVALAGHQVASKLGLRSNFFTLRVEAPVVPEGAPVAEGTVPGAGDARLTVGGVRARLGPPTGEGMGRVPWIALALLLLVAVTLARRGIAGPQQPSGAGVGGREAEAHAGAAVGRPLRGDRPPRGQRHLADDGEPEP